MKNIYIMIVITIIFFIASMDFLYYTNVFVDLIFVIVYLMLVSRLSLKLESKEKEVDKEYVLNEKNTAYFAPLIFLFFLSFSVSVGAILVIINILLIVLLYIYVFVSISKNKIIVSNKDITAKYLNGKTTSMKWQSIVKVDFNWVYNILIFTDAQGSELKLDITLEDFLLVIIMMKENLLKDDYQNAFEKLRIYNKIFLIRSNNIYLQ